MADDWVVPEKSSARTAGDDWVVPGAGAPKDDRGAVDKLLGIGGPRYQTFPERIVRGVGDAFLTGAELTKKAATGEYGPTGEGILQEDPGKIISAASLGVSGAPEAAKIAGGIVDAAAKAKQIRAELPSTQEIKASAKASYKAVADARLIASEGSVNNLVSATRAGLDERLFTDATAPGSFKAIEQLQKSGGDIANIMGIRQRLGEIKPSAGSDYEAAQHVKEAIDNYIETLPPGEIVQGDPQFTQEMLSHARASWRSYAQLDQVESAMEIGRHQAAVAGTGANTQNAMRQRIRSILDSDKSRGLSPEAKEQMEDIVMGTFATNTARWAGKYAPSGPVSALTTTMAALGGDIAGGRGMATAAAAAVAIPATIAKYLGTYLTKRQITELENIIRSESPLGRSTTSWIENQPPGAASRAAGASTALIPALAAGAASPLASGGQ